MTLHLYHDRWWKIVCTPSGPLFIHQMGRIVGAVRRLLLKITYHQGYHRSTCKPLHLRNTHGYYPDIVF